MKKFVFTLNLIALLIAIHSFSASARSEARFTGSIAVQEKNKKNFPDLAKLSFQNVLSLIEKNHPGKIIEVALEEEDGFLVYEVEMITPEKTKKEIIIDAGNGSILFVKNKNSKK